MIFPPSLQRVRVQTPKHRIGLWLPLFVIWPFALLLAVVLLPFVLITAMLTRNRGWSKTILLSGPLAFNLFCALRGLEIRVDQRGQKVLVYFI